MLQASINSRRIHYVGTLPLRDNSSHRTRQSRRFCFAKRGRNMTTYLFGAALLAAIVSIAVPAHAAKMGGCSSPNLEKTETMIENMADGDGKWTAQKEVALAQDA